MEYDRNDDSKPSRFTDICRCAVGGHSAKSCPISLSKEARRNTIDKLRSRRIAVMMETIDDSSDSSSSDEDYSSDESSDGDMQMVSVEEQQLLDGKKQLQQHTSGLLLKLTQSLRICKRKVDSLSPKVFRPNNVRQLRGAVDIALYAAERIKSTSVSSTTTLHGMTLRASTISNLMYIADNMHSNPSYCCLVRIRNLLTLATRVAAVMHAYAGKLASGIFESQLNQSKLSAQLNSGSTEMEDGNGMELNQPDMEDKTQDVQMVEPDEACKSLTDKPYSSSDDFANRKCTHLGGKCRYATGEQSSKPSHLALSKEARKAAFDRNRSKRISATMKKNSYSKDPDSESDDSDEYTDDSASDDDYTDSSSGESSDETSDESSDESSDDDSQEVYEQRRLMEMKKKMRQQTATFLMQLIKCLSTCKREVYTLSPSLVRPDITKLRDAVDNALFMTERIKRVSINSTASLKTMTQTAATIARVVYIPDSMHSTATRSSYHKLLRIRRFLNLALRVAAVLYAYTVKLFSGELKPQISKVKESNASDHGSDGRDGHNQHDVEEKSQCVKKVETGEGCSSNETRNMYDTSNSEEKPEKLVVSFKIPTSLGICKNSSNPVLPEVPVKPKAIDCCRRAVLHDIVDVGVVMEKKPSSRSDYNPHIGEMINDLLWKVRREVVEKQSTEATLKSVEKQSIFKSSCRKSRFSPYAGRPTLRKASHSSGSIKIEKNTYVSSKIQSPASDPQRKTDSEFSVVHGTSLSKFSEPVLLKCTPYQQRSVKLSPSMPPVKSAAMESTFNKHSIITEKQNYRPPKTAQQWQRREPEMSMDELADMFLSKFNTSVSVSCNFSNVSFKDPHGHKLTSAVVPREQYPGVALQDGGVKFVLRESPLTQVLQCRKLEGKDLNVLPQSMLNTTQFDQKSSEGTPGNFASGQCSPTTAVAEPHVKVVDEQTEPAQQFVASNMKGKPESSVVFNNFSAKATNKTELLKSMVPVQYVPPKTSFSNLSSKPEELKSVLEQSAQQEQSLKPVHVIPMDELADLFESKCKISESVSRNYSSICFKDPRVHELTSAVIPREQYPGVALQDGGVKFVLRQSPLTQVLQRRKLEGKNLNILPQSVLNAPKLISYSEASSKDEVKSLTPCTISPITTNLGHLLPSTDIERAISAAHAMRKPASRAMLKPTRRRLHPNLSNVLAARKNPQCEQYNEHEIDEYRRIVGANVEVLGVNNAKEQSRRVRLGKRTATEAGLPVPTGK